MHLWEAVLREMAGDGNAEYAIRRTCSTRDRRANQGRIRALRATKRPSDRQLATMAANAKLEPAAYMRELLERAGYCEAGQEVALVGVQTRTSKGGGMRGTVKIPTRGTALESSLVLSVSAMPDVVRRALGTEERINRYCEILLRDLESDAESKAHAEAMSLFPKLLGLIGGGQDAEEIVKKLLGVKNMVEALRKLQVADLAERVETDEDAEREALKFVNECRAARGQRALIDPEVMDAEVIG